MRSQLAAAIAEIRLPRAAHFGEVVRSEARVTPEELLDLVVERPILADVLVSGLEAAVRSDHDEKRVLLGRVVAAALRADDDQILESPLFLRTAVAIEAYDLRVFMRIATPKAGGGKYGLHADYAGGVTTEELETTYPEQRHLMGPILSALEREDLIYDIGQGGIYLPERTWRPTEYGRQFLASLPGHPAHKIAEVVLAFFEQDSSKVRVRNLGPGVATVTVVELRRASVNLLANAPVPFDLRGGDHLDLPVDLPGDSQLIASVSWYSGSPGAWTLELSTSEHRRVKELAPLR